MQTIMVGTRGLTVLFQIQKDRLLGLGAVGVALLAGAWLSSLILG